MMTENIGISRLLTNAANKYGALCLDGSPGRYYINTNVTETHKYVMFLEGGGWCSGLYQSTAPNTKINACFDRRDTRLGSTRNDTQTMDLNDIGILAKNNTMNPLLHEWIKIYVRYCDGASFSGNRLQSIHHKNDTQQIMYFRGKRILSAVFDDLRTHFGLSQATDFVFSGGSAGGLAVFLNAHDIASQFNQNQTKVVAVPIVGYFIDYNGYYNQHKTNYSNALKWIYHQQNISSSICEYNSDKCMFPQNIATNIDIPVFVVNSRYDAWQIENILFGQKIYASMNWDLVNEFGDNFTKIITKNYLSYDHANNNHFGAFITSCYFHHSSKPSTWDSTMIDNYSPADAFMLFYESFNGAVADKKTRYLWIDNKTSSRYPCNTCCPQYFPFNICLNVTTFNTNVSIESAINGLYKFEGYVDEYPFYKGNRSYLDGLYLLHNEGNHSWEMYPSLMDRNMSFVSWYCDSHNVLKCDLQFIQSNVIQTLDIWECDSYQISNRLDSKVIIVFYSIIVFALLFCIFGVIGYAIRNKWWKNKFQQMSDNKYEVHNENDSSNNEDKETVPERTKNRNISNITKSLSKLKPSRKGYAEVETEETVEI